MQEKRNLPDLRTALPACPVCGAPLARGRNGEICPVCLLGVAMAEPSQAGCEPPALPDVATLQALFPDFEILGLLGRGGMGAVYQVRQAALDRLAALKILPPELAAQPGFRERFHREARTMAALNHPHIVTIHESGERGGVFYFLMEFVAGGDLGHAIRNATLSTREVLAIIPQICDALQYAHDSGVVHRDIKPANILLDARGRVKIVDFGIAKIVAAGHDPGLPADHTLGTPEYMAPEQRAGADEVDHRVDIYSLGAVFYELLTGRRPGAADDGNVPAVTIAPRLERLVRRAMADDRELRYQHVSELREELERLHRPRALAWPLATGLVVAALIIGFAMRQRPAEPPDGLPPAWENSLGMQFRPVPGTAVRMAIWETRVRDWREFEQEAGLTTGAKPAGGDAQTPVTVCNADRIIEFCAWLTRRERASGRIHADESYRLPSDREWSLAAGLQEPADASPPDLHLKNRSHYPWGTRAPVPPQAGNYADSALRERIPTAVVIPGCYDGHAFAAPVAAFPPNAAGFHDLGGNVWEAVTGGPATNRNDAVLFRGGSWFAGATDGDWTRLLSSFRAQTTALDPAEAGFRIVLAKSAARPEPSVLDAARDGDLATLKKLLAAGADPNSSDASGRTPLHVAARRGDAEVVGLLITAGAKLDARDDTGLAPIHAAAGAGAVATLRALVRAGADVHHRGRLTGMVPVHLAATADAPEILEFLAGEGANLNASDNSGASPLHHAANARARAAVSWLVAHRVPVDTRDQEQQTALDMAALAGDEETCALLLRLGADATGRPNARTSPLTWAVTAASPEIVELLLNHGADATAVAVGTATGLDVTALQVGARRAGTTSLAAVPLRLPPPEPGRRAAVIRLLVAHGMPLEQTDSLGMTPLLNAAYHGNTEALQTLLDCGAKADAADNQGFTALHSAAEQGFVKVVELLLAKRAAPDATNDVGRTALDCAVLTNRRDVALRLLDSAASVDGPPAAASRPVVTAALQGHPEMLALLLERGGNPNASLQPSGMTAMIGAAITAPCAGDPLPPFSRKAPHGTPADYDRCVALLLERGANPRATMNDGTTALHAAADSNQARTVGLLLESGVAAEVLDHQAFTPLHRTAHHDAVAAARVLLDHGASTAHPVNPNTPLHAAAAADARKVAALLLERGAAVDPRDGKGATPLHWAVATGHAEMVKLLAGHGADLAARDFIYNTPLHTAVVSCKPEIVRTLLEAGANPALRNIAGVSPLDIAVARHLPEITQVFSSHKPPPPPPPNP